MIWQAVRCCFTSEGAKPLIVQPPKHLVQRPYTSTVVGVRGIAKIKELILKGAKGKTHSNSPFHPVIIRHVPVSASFGINPYYFNIDCMIRLLV